MNIFVQLSKFSERLVPFCNFEKTFYDLFKGKKYSEGEIENMQKNLCSEKLPHFSNEIVLKF